MMAWQSRRIAAGKPKEHPDKFDAHFFMVLAVVMTFVCVITYAFILIHG